MVFGYATEARGQLILHVKARIGRQDCFLVAITQFLKTKAAEIVCDTVLTAGYIGALMMCDRRGSVKGDRVPHSLCAAFPHIVGESEGATSVRSHNLEATIGGATARKAEIVQEHWDSNQLSIRLQRATLCEFCAKEPRAHDVIK